jgi:hypothetical protein
MMFEDVATLNVGIVDGDVALRIIANDEQSRTVTTLALDTLITSFLGAGNLVSATTAKLPCSEVVQSLVT